MVTAPRESRIRPRPTGYTLVEVLLVVGIFVVVLALVVGYFGFGRRSEQRLTARMGAQQATRKALVRFVQELQESVEVLSPRPGSTLSYALVRDQVNAVRWYYQVRTPGSPDSAPTFEVWRFATDTTLPGPQRRVKLLGGVKRLTFTARSEGGLRLNLVTTEDGQDHATLLSVRLRNIAVAEEVW